MASTPPLPAPVSPTKAQLTQTAVGNLWKWATLAIANNVALRAEIEALEKQLVAAADIHAQLDRIEAAVGTGTPVPVPPASYPTSFTDKHGVWWEIRLTGANGGVVYRNGVATVSDGVIRLIYDEVADAIYHENAAHAFWLWVNGNPGFWQPSPAPTLP